jgi:nucleoside-diphosphate-sugar epimerase
LSSTTRDESAKVLITGAEGFTGRYLAPELAQAGYEVHGIVREPQAAIAGTHQLHSCDLSDIAGLARVAQVVAPAHVVHLAGISFVAYGDVEDIYRTNVVGTRNLLEALANAVPSELRSVVLASSSNVYGNATPGVLDESCQPAPANDYAVSKLAMEYVAALYASRLPIVIARPFNYTGVGQDQNFLLPKIVSHFRQGCASIELGNLDVARDFSDVRTVARCYRLLLEAPSAIGGTFNICSGHAYSLFEVMDLMRELSGRDLQVRVNADLVRQNEVKTLLGSRNRLDAAVGAVPPIPLRETLRWMLYDQGGH